MMYYITKYADCWAVHNDANGKSRALTQEEEKLAQKEFHQLLDPQVQTIYADQVTTLQSLP